MLCVLASGQQLLHETQSGEACLQGQTAPAKQGCACISVRACMLHKAPGGQAKHSAQAVKQAGESAIRRASEASADAAPRHHRACIPAHASSAPAGMSASSFSTAVALAKQQALGDCSAIVRKLFFFFFFLRAPSRSRHRHAPAR